MPDDNLTFYTVRDVAEIFKVQEATVRQWIRDGDLGALRVGNRWRVSKEHLKTFTNEHYD